MAAPDANDHPMSSLAPTAPLPRPGLSPLVLLCLAATWIVWGSTYLAIKFALWSFPPFFQMGTRFLFAGALLMAWMRWRGAPWPDARQWRNALVVGTLMLGGGMGGTAFAEVTVGSGLVVAFIAVVPLMIAALNLIWGIVPGRLEIAGIAVGLVGVLMLTQGAGFQASPAGLAAIAIACGAWSLGSVLSQRRLPLAPGATGFASEMLCGGAVLMVLSAITGEHPAWPAEPAAVAAWLYLVVFGSLIAFSAYRYLVERVSPTLAATYAYANPPVALFVGWWLGSETFSANTFIGLPIVLLAVALHAWSWKTSTTAATTAGTAAPRTAATTAAD